MGRAGALTPNIPFRIEKVVCISHPWFQMRCLPTARPPVMWIIGLRQVANPCATAGQLQNVCQP